jgi:hypothetical protein
MNVEQDDHDDRNAAQAFDITDPAARMSEGCGLVHGWLSCERLAGINFGPGPVGRSSPKGALWSSARMMDKA